MGIQSLKGREKEEKRNSGKHPKQKAYKKVIEQALSCFTEFLSHEALTIYNVYSLLPEGYWSLLQAFYARLGCNSAECHVYKAWQQFTSDFTINSVYEYEEFEVHIFPSYLLMAFSCRTGEALYSYLFWKGLISNTGLSHQARHRSPGSLFDYDILGVISWEKKKKAWSQ